MSVTAAGPVERRAGRWSSRRLDPLNALLGAAGVIGFVLLWELIVRVGVVESRFLPPPSVVAVALGEALRDVGTWIAVGLTLRSWAIGLGIAVVASLVLGVSLGLNDTARRYARSTIELMRPVPSVALIPVAVLLLGVDAASTVFLVVFAAFWQLLVQVMAGVADMDPVAQNTARAFGFSWATRMRFLVLPSVLPYGFTGLRLAASTALVLAVTGELVIGTDGLGKEIFLAQSGGAIPLMYARILLVGVIGVGINLVLRVAERRLLRWHASVRGAE